MTDPLFRTLLDLLDHPRAGADRLAAIFPDERATFGELSRASRDVARQLLGAGVGPGDHVGLMLSGGVDYLAALIATMRIRAVPVPINSRFKAMEIASLVAHAELALILTTGEGAPFVDYPGVFVEAFPDLPFADPTRLKLSGAPGLGQIVLLDDTERPGFVARGDFVAAGSGVPGDALADLESALAPGDVALILYTSGTTARPKGAMITHAGLLQQARVLSETGLELTPEDIVWSPLPTFHISYNATVVAAWYAGAAVCHPGFFRPDVSLAQLASERCTIALPGFETVWLDVLSEPGFADADLSSLRLVFSVGVAERLRSMEARLPSARMVTGFGGTETSGWLSIGKADDDPGPRLSTGGFPMPGWEIRIVDIETGEDLPPGRPGEVLLRGPQRFIGYASDEAYTASVIDAEDWYHSGDVCVRDEQGRISFVNRVKDMLKVGGENVAAAEIEDFLFQHPAVRIVQVVSAPDARYGEVPAAFVELEPEARVTEEELIELCIGRIASFKVPRYVRFVTEWPMSGTKIQKVRLRERIAEELSVAGITRAPKVTSRGLEAPDPAAGLGSAPGRPVHSSSSPRSTRGVRDARGVSGAAVPTRTEGQA